MKNIIFEDLISKEIQNSAKLLQTINLHALISGGKGTGKKTLAKYILNKSKFFNAKDLQKDIEDNILNIKNTSIIIIRIEDITNINLFINWINKNNIRVIATSNQLILNKEIKDIFSINLNLKELKYRKKDTHLLIKKFSNEASQVLNMPLIKENKLSINLNDNAHSLKKSIYFSYLFETIGKEEILMFLEKYIEENFEEEENYKKLIHLYEVPLIKIAKKKYKSQVKISKKLGINRITLRKKIETHKDLL